MAELQIGAILLFLLFYVITRTAWVKVIKENDLVIELHLPLLALVFTDKKDKKKKKKTKGPLGLRTYISIAAAVLDRSHNLDIELNSITLPRPPSNFTGMTLVKPFGYQALLYSIIAFLGSKARSLTISDNAIISSPDVTEAHFNFTVKAMLFQLIYTLITVKRLIDKEKSDRRKNVGE